MIITRRAGEAIRIGDTIRIEVAEIGQDKVQLIIVVPYGVEVVYGDLGPDLDHKREDVPQHLKEALAQLRWGLVDQALRLTRGNRQQAARLLGLKRTTLVEMLRRRPRLVEKDPEGGDQVEGQ